MPAIAFRIARTSAFALLLVFTNLTAAGIDSSGAAIPFFRARAWRTYRSGHRYRPSERTLIAEFRRV